MFHCFWNSPSCQPLTLKTGPFKRKNKPEPKPTLNRWQRVKWFTVQALLLWWLWETSLSLLMYRMNHLFVIVFSAQHLPPPPPLPLWRGKEEAHKACRLCLLVKVENSEGQMKATLGLMYEIWHERPSQGICLLPHIPYSCHLIISQAGGKEADVTRLSSHLGTLYFRQCSFLRGHRSTTPKWCVGVCSGPARVWVTGLAHPHQHDTARKSRPARLPAEAGSADPAARPARVPSMYFPRVWATGGACEEERENKNALSRV